MFKKKPLVVVVVLIVIGLLFVALGGCTSKSSGDKAQSQSTASKPQVIELKFSHHDPTTGSTHLGAQEWAKLVEEKAQGTVKITIYPAETLAKTKDSYDALIGGVSDIGWIATAYYPGRFPMTEAAELPFLGFSSVEQAYKVLWDLYNNTDYIKKEFSEAKVLLMYSTTPNVDIGSNKPIRTLEDLKGLKIATIPLNMINFLKQAGALPASLSAPDIYEGMQRGVVNAYIMPWAATKNFRYAEVSKYHTNVRFSIGVRWVAMNKKTWESLPDVAKKAFEECGGVYGASVFAKPMQQAEDTVIKEIKDNKEKTYLELTPEEEKRWKQVAKEAIWEKWIKDKEGQNLPGKAVLEEVQKAIENYAGK
ncbi:MAG: TRAP transporter substrate-binding protein [Peptococcaceae bacterium]|jgi:TRAP-type C4-dicarboxylate transport system substrate-binding protein|nr:TRAP transporter substrate-binding protein [Peptococcaceae bacterium]MDH7524163.1 TRAP transporter substrate-binding protein [Peptococcaceae bacterium]